MFIKDPSKENAGRCPRWKMSAWGVLRCEFQGRFVHYMFVWCCSTGAAFRQLCPFSPGRFLFFTCPAGLSSLKCLPSGASFAQGLMSGAWHRAPGLGGCRKSRAQSTPTQRGTLHEYRKRGVTWGKRSGEPNDTRVGRGFKTGAPAGARRKPNLHVTFCQVTRGQGWGRELLGKSFYVSSHIAILMHDVKRAGVYPAAVEGFSWARLSRLHSLSRRMPYASSPYYTQLNNTRSRMGLPKQSILRFHCTQWCWMDSPPYS